jgi:hypothetical protein
MVHYYILYMEPKLNYTKFSNETAPYKLSLQHKMTYKFQSEHFYI